MSSERASDEIKSRLDIVDVIGGHVRLTRAGREWKGLCPFHTEHTASFYVNPEKQLWNCHGCHEGGDIFHFVELIDHTDFRGALEELAKRAGVDLSQDRSQSPAEIRRRKQREALLQLNQLAVDFYHHVLLQSPAGKQGRSFLDSRGVTEEDRERFKLGYAPLGTTQDNLVRFLRRRQAEPADIAASGLARNDRGRLTDFFRQRVVIPIRDEQGRPVGFGGRAIAAGSPKYLNTRSTSLFEKSNVLFGLDLSREAMHREHRAVLMEGYFDVIGAHRIGIRNAVSVSGTALTDAQVRLLRRFSDEVILCFDGDDAGQTAAGKAVGLVAQAGMNCRLFTLAESQDPDDLSRSDPAALRELVEKAPPAWEALVDGALGEASPSSGGQGQEALRRAMKVLGRIPEASIRALYAERVGRRLGVDASRILKDVEQGDTRQPVKSRAEGLSQVASGEIAMGASAHLLGMLWHSPQLVAEVRDQFQVRRDDFLDPQHGDLYQAMVDVAPERLSPADLAPELRVRLDELPKGGFPELAEDAGEARRRRSLGDYVKRIRIETLENQAATLRRRLGELSHHREGEGPQLAAELDRKQRQIEALRRSGGVEA
ncbi:MAG TPA: DNA primase [Candidatus Acidoferrales bacterium]|nr:DNA primase [Candidatus Acidoferrales bacterium]